jgi:hypothetical protein
MGAENGKSVLSKKRISASADHVELRLKPDSTKRAAPEFVTYAQKDGHVGRSCSFGVRHQALLLLSRRRCLVDRLGPPCMERLRVDY